MKSFYLLLTYVYFPLTIHETKLVGVQDKELQKSTCFYKQTSSSTYFNGMLSVLSSLSLRLLYNYIIQKIVYFICQFWTFFTCIRGLHNLKLWNIGMHSILIEIVIYEMSFWTQQDLFLSRNIQICTVEIFHKIKTSVKVSCGFWLSLPLFCLKMYLLSYF